MTFLEEFPWMGETQCVVCDEPTLYARRCRPNCPCGGRSSEQKAPKTCGRLACMVQTGEMKAVGVA